jgi:hypothetical protein
VMIPASSLHEGVNGVKLYAIEGGGALRPLGGV